MEKWRRCMSAVADANQRHLSGLIRPARQVPPWYRAAHLASWWGLKSVQALDRAQHEQPWTLLRHARCNRDRTGSGHPGFPGLVERTGRKKSAANTEAVVVVPVVGFVPVAPRRAHVPGVVVPGAAAKDTSLRATQASGRLTCFQWTARPEDRWWMMSSTLVMRIAETIACGEIRSVVLHTNRIGKKVFAGGYAPRPLTRGKDVMR